MVTPRKAETLAESSSRRALFWRSRSKASDILAVVVVVRQWCLRVWFSPSLTLGWVGWFAH
jgi:hypothetical protein